MNFPGLKRTSPDVEGKRAVAVKSFAGGAEAVVSVRDVMRGANDKVSAPMDTAIIAGGLVGGNVKVIQEKTNDLHNQISTASSSIEEIAANVRQFNGIVERQNNVLSEAGNAVDEMAASVTSVTEVTRMKMSDAGRLQEIIDKGGEDVKSTARAIEEVTVGLDAVAGVIKVINSIAAQTNLLAMNAAIEAAHAGEFGKGFAVVASEVRKLAESTTENSKAIANSLKGIIDQIQVAKKVGESAGNSFGTIQKEVENFVGAFSDIARASSGLTGGARQIISSMEALKQVSSEISGGSREIAAGSDNIDSSLRHIKDFSTGLMDDMKSIQEKILDISGAQSGIALYMVETNRSIENFFQQLVTSGDIPKEDALFNYGLIVLMHRNWLIQLRAFLDNRKDNLTATSEDHLKCDLGKWIYGDGTRFGQQAAYKQLEAEHKKFHTAAGAIIQAKKDGKIPHAEEMYQKLMDDYHTVVSLLDKLKSEN